MFWGSILINMNFLFLFWQLPDTNSGKPCQPSPLAMLAATCRKIGGLVPAHEPHSHPVAAPQLRHPDSNAIKTPSPLTATAAVVSAGHPQRKYELPPTPPAEAAVPPRCDCVSFSSGVMHHSMLPADQQCFKNLWSAATGQTTDLTSLAVAHHPLHPHIHPHAHTCHTLSLAGIHHPIPHTYSPCNTPSPPVTPTYHHHHHHHHGLSLPPVSPAKYQHSEPELQRPQPRSNDPTRRRHSLVEFDAT